MTSAKEKVRGHSTMETKATVCVSLYVWVSEQYHYHCVCVLLKLVG